MSKTSITTDELVALFDQIGKKSFSTILAKIDPDLKEEDLYYYHSRLQFFFRTSKEKITMGQAAILMMKEEKVESVAVALAMYGFCNFKLGFDVMNKNTASNVLDKLADDFEKRTDVIKVKITDDGKIQKDTGQS